MTKKNRRTRDINKYKGREKKELKENQPEDLRKQRAP